MIDASTGKFKPDGRAWTPERRAKMEKYREVRLANLAKMDRRPGRKKRLNKNQELFVEKYRAYGNATQAYREVYGDKGENTRHMAWVVLHTPSVQKFIIDTETIIAKEGRGSIEKLVELKDSGDERIQLGAAKAILEAYAELLRRQQKAMEPDKETTNNILITGMSDAELVARIQQLGGQGAVPGAIEAEVQD